MPEDKTKIQQAKDNLAKFDVLQQKLEQFEQEAKEEVKLLEEQVRKDSIQSLKQTQEFQELVHAITIAQLHSELVKKYKKLKHTITEATVKKLLEPVEKKFKQIAEKITRNAII